MGNRRVNRLRRGPLCCWSRIPAKWTSPIIPATKGLGEAWQLAVTRAVSARRCWPSCRRTARWWAVRCKNPSCVRQPREVRHGAGLRQRSDRETDVWMRLVGKPEGSAGFASKRGFRAFIWLLISVCNLCIKDRAEARGLSPRSGKLRCLHRCFRHCRCSLKTQHPLPVF
jgi:hypothetical protein